MLTAFCMVTLIGAISFVKDNPTQKDIEAAADLTISNFSQLKSFAEAVNGGNDYAGKTVLLMDDIDCGGENFSGIGGGEMGNDITGSGNTFYSFKGSFNGNGFCISNVKLTGYYYHFHREIAGQKKYDRYHKYYSGLFINLEGTVSNLRVSNCSFNITRQADKPMTGYTIYYDYYFYGFVANRTASGTISSCWIDGTSGYTGVGTIKDVMLSNGIINSSGTSITSANNVSGLTWSAEGGRDIYETYPWYYSSQYKNGWPRLRVFMKDWLTINFQAETGGSVNPTYIEIPGDAGSVGIDNLKNSTITLLDQVITATADTQNGYYFDTWRIDSATLATAVFERESFLVKFEPASYADGTRTGELKITVNGATNTRTEWYIFNGETLSASQSVVLTAQILTYKFKDKDLNSVEIKYTVYGEKYKYSSYQNTIQITSDLTIQPIIDVKTFTVTAKAADGSDITSDKVWTVEYGSKVDYIKSGSILKFTFGGDVIKYTAQSGYKYEKIIIKRSGEEVESSALANITGDIEIQPVLARWYIVTFAPAVDELGNIDKATITSAQNQIDVKENTRITSSLSQNGKMLTYSYNGKEITYEANQYYVLNNGNNNLTITGDQTITPIVKFHACKVTIENTSKDTEADNQYMAKMTVDEQEKTTYTFVVEYGKTVEVTSPESGTYTYTFSSDQVITFTTGDKYEIDSYGLDESGTLTSYSFDNTEEKQKVISPTFKVKTYKLTVESNIGEELEAYEIYYGSTVTYSANLSLSDNSKFELTYNCIYNPFAKKTYEETDYFLEYYKINDVANYLDDFVIYNENIVVKSDISIKLEFATFVTIEFTNPGTGIASVSNIGTYNVRTGSGIIATKPEYPEKYLTYKITDQTRTIEVKYTLEQYYTVEDLDISEFGNGKIQTSEIITPIVKFNACIVTMTKTDTFGVATMLVSGDSYGTTNDGIFVVEFGTEIEFESSQSGGKFTYVYTFKYGEAIVATVTYGVQDNKYAMESEITEEERVWYTKLGEDKKSKEDSLTEDKGTEYIICPIFDYKKYSGELA